MAMTISYPVEFEWIADGEVCRPVRQYEYNTTLRKALPPVRASGHVGGGYTPGSDSGTDSTIRCQARMQPSRKAAQRM